MSGGEVLSLYFYSPSSFETLNYLQGMVFSVFAILWQKLLMNPILPVQWLSNVLSFVLDLRRSIEDSHRMINRLLGLEFNCS